MKAISGCLALLTTAVSFAHEWSIESIDSHASSPSIAIDSDDYPHIAYCVDDEALKYARWNGSGWEFQIVDSSGSVGGGASLALDSLDHPHIAYYDWKDSSLKYTRWDGSSWITTSVCDSGCWISMVLDSSCNPHIAYSNYSSEYPEVRYAYWTGTYWLHSMVSYPGGFYPSIALDSSDRPHLSYHQENGYDLEYAYLNSDMEWEKFKVDTDGQVGTCTSISLGSSGFPFISYISHSDGLKLASWNGTSWETENVDDSDMWTSIALDNDDNPHIVSSNSDDEDLTYASWNGSDWEIEAVDSIDISGWGWRSSLTLDSSQNPHIAYTDAENSNLKYAWKPGQETPDESNGFSSIQVQPNPFSSSLSITYNLPGSAAADVSVFDISGRRQANLVSGLLPGGENSIIWDPDPAIPAGCYLVVLDSGGRRISSLVVFIR